MELYRNKIVNALLKLRLLKMDCWDFPCGPVAKTPCSKCRQPGFYSCLGNWILHAATKSWHAKTKRFCMLQQR